MVATMSALKFLSLVTVSLSLICTLEAQECDVENGYNSLYTRVMFLQFDGTFGIPANRTHHQNIYGSCRDFDDHVQYKLEYFESFGFDMTSVKADPFQPQSTDEFTITPYRNLDNSNHTLNLVTFYEYAEVMNTLVTFGSFGMVLKRDKDGPKGRLTNGTFLLSGVMRLIVDGIVHCVEYRSRNDNTWIGASDVYTPYTLDMYSHEFGPGVLTGLLIKRENGVVEDTGIITFPSH